MTSEDDVRAASEKFYAALNRMLNGDARALQDIWSHGKTVTTMHPIGGREVGWDQVRKSWEQVAQLTTEGQVRLSEQFIQVIGVRRCSDLAVRAVVGRALSLPDAADHGTADPAGPAGAFVDIEPLAEITGIAVGADVIAQRRAAGADRCVERRAHRAHQASAIGA